MADKFMDRLLAGEALLDEIDDYVAEWHDGPSSEELHAHLGLTWEEYALWVEQPNVLRLIVAARARERPVAEMLAHAQDYALAARGGLSEKEVRSMRTWLQETGRLPRT
jgi:hypothetical protein